MGAQNWWGEETLQNSLLSFLCRDRQFLKQFGTRLSKKDFKGGTGESNSREVIASIALEYWKKYHEPVGGLLKSEVLDYISSNKVDSKNRKVSYNKKELLEVLEFITGGEKLVPVVAMEDKVTKYLENKFIKDSLDNVLELQEKGELSKKKFADICRNVSDFKTKQRLESKNLISGSALEDRIVRRTKDRSVIRPYLFIDGIDRKTRIIGRGDLGVLLAPLKMGKSLGLAHIAVAYAKQRLNVLYISLEDPIEEVEDRFDASISGIDIDKLSILPNKLKKRFRKFSKVINSRIHLVDGTSEAVTVPDVEELYLRERDNGFCADVIIIDYDEYLTALGKYSKKSEMFDEIYKSLRRFLAKYSLIGWTAAQSQRTKEDAEVIRANQAADDIGKMRKATLAIGIGQGKNHANCRYLYVAAHKRGRQHIGCTIWTNFSKGLFYDRDKTLRMERTKKTSKDI